MLELIERLKRINAKITLKQPLTAHEQAAWTLYGAILIEEETI